MHLLMGQICGHTLSSIEMESMVSECKIHVFLCSYDGG